MTQDQFIEYFKKLEPEVLNDKMEGTLFYNEMNVKLTEVIRQRNKDSKALKSDIKANHESSLQKIKEL